MIKGIQQTTKVVVARRGVKRRHRRAKKGSTAFDWLTYKSRAASLRLLKRNGIRVDTLIVTRDGFSEPVHWQVFSAACPKLIRRAKVSRDATSRRIVELPVRISRDNARLLIQCAYGEPHLALDESNLDQFYKLCSKFHIDQGVSLCLNHARKLLNAENCIYLYRLACWHRHKKLKHSAYVVIRTNFKLLMCSSRDFHRIDLKCLKRLLTDNTLKLNEDEELAWLAILRWTNKRPMTQSKLIALYNRMVASSQDVQINIFPRSNNNGNNNLVQLGITGRQSGRRHSLNEPALQVPLRYLINFHSPGLSTSRNEQPPSSKRRSTIEASPLRTISEKYIVNAAQKPEDEALFYLLKYLRFMRFRSVNAFDVIASEPLVMGSEKLTNLINYMRIRYKLRHKIALSCEDKQRISQEQLIKLKYEESSRTKRLMKRVTNLVGLQANGDFDRDQSFAMNYEQNNDCKISPGDQLGTRSLERAAQPRVPKSIGLLFGGWQDGSISKTIWAYDFIYDQWFKLNIKLPEARALHASCSSPTTGHVYIFGGTDGEQILKSVWRFNPASDVRLTRINAKATNIKVTKNGKSFNRNLNNGPHEKTSYRFKQLRPMNEARCHLSGVFHSDGRVYALGGHNGSQRLKTAERYDPKSDQWHKIADMTIARSDAAACSHENKIFIAGGQISDSFIQSTVEFYKSSDNSWTFAAPMIIPRMSFCLASYKGLLLALGGTNGLMGGEEVASVTRSVERYDRDSASWSFCIPMGQKRCSFGAMLVENKLIVLGGHSGSRRLKTSETLRISNFSAAPATDLTLRDNQQQQQQQQPPPPQLPGRAAASGSVAPTPAMPQSPIAAGPPNLRRSNSLPGTMRMVTDRSNQVPRNQLLLRLMNNYSDAQQANQMTLSRAMKWVKRADLPERRSGFSLAVVNELRNARDYTYFGSIKRQRATRANVELGKRNSSEGEACLIRQPSRWKRFKVIKRRKLIKHIKIALVVSIVILML